MNKTKQIIVRLEDPIMEQWLSICATFKGSTRSDTFRRVIKRIHSSIDEINDRKTMENNKRTHFYILPDGKIVENQLEGRKLLGIGRNAFRNRVKNGSIQKITNNPQGYGQEQENIYNQC